MSTSFERGLRILTEVIEHGDASVEAVSRKLGIPASSAYRYFKVLREQDFVCEEDGRYRPGPALLRSAGRHHAQSYLAEVGNAVLREIVDQVGETAVMIVRIGSQAMCLRRVEPEKSLKYSFAVNELLPLHAGAGQRVLLAWAPPEVVHEVLTGSMTRFTAKTMNREQILASIPQTRSSGYVLSRGELDQGSLSIAIPVTSQGEVVCSINVAGPEATCGSRFWISSTLRVMQESANKLTQALQECTPNKSTRETLDDYSSIG
ncbi:MULTISPECIES: IclR family transcriptional regulator [Paeniglutamicibacter]|uniref:DNA-binding IclR family transcriptional regulator n=1 Tax=Paeniglutamicibacter sulfureus TaxID=43666 RepID=A0ABU2BHT8_9MICC|nr:MULTISPECIES: IclR family transcriptional regulator [Paeniglutamicibacter]MCV9993213.1 IclR family transcriptional regulator [Paeniglutamicibacter sp. ZC-3]MDO2933439.1 IclR family transcriptional regulator [Paeniglutamicibacter sulfureus]MDR7357846.1 DNA-binding IclR family transcriptional regulator [Paeniglutamicibacter sulfureus]